jgi:hypothetical protein
MPHVFSIPEEPWGYLFVGMVPQGRGAVSCLVHAICRGRRWASVGTDVPAGRRPDW